jgi:hypothetical protein
MSFICGLVIGVVLGFLGFWGWAMYDCSQYHQTCHKCGAQIEEDV